MTVGVRWFNSHSPQLTEKLHLSNQCIENYALSSHINYKIDKIGRALMCVYSDLIWSNDVYMCVCLYAFYFRNLFDFACN